MPEWNADLVVDAALARRFPQLAPASLAHLADGWDNGVWLVNDRWAFRFPRREIAVAGVRREIAVLPRLAPLLPLAIPVPTFVGRPGDDYPWPFFGAELIRGRELSELTLTDRSRTALARPLARFLRVLHGEDVAAAIGAGNLPADPNGRAHMGRRVPSRHQRLAQFEQLGLWRRPAVVDEVLDAAFSLPPSERLALTHGDLHFRHLLLADDGSPTGIIDWGDVCRGDPAIDLPLLWSTLTAQGRAEFIREYGPLRESQVLRARVLALFLCAAIAIYAHGKRPDQLAREALAGLVRASASE